MRLLWGSRMNLCYMEFGYSQHSNVLCTSPKESRGNNIQGRGAPFPVNIYKVCTIMFVISFFFFFQRFRLVFRTPLDWDNWMWSLTETNPCKRTRDQYVQTCQMSTVKQSTATRCDSGRDLSYLIGVMLDCRLLLQQCSQRRYHSAAVGHWLYRLHWLPVLDVFFCLSGLSEGAYKATLPYFLFLFLFLFSSCLIFSLYGYIVVWILVRLLLSERVTVTLTENSQWYQMYQHQQ